MACWGVAYLAVRCTQSVGRIQSQSDGPKARTRHRGQGILRNQQGELCAGETAGGATLQSSEENPNMVWKLSPTGWGQASLPPAAAVLPLISCFIAYRVKAIEYDSAGTARKPKPWTPLTRNPMKLGLLAWHAMRITIVVMISAPVGQGQGTMCSQKWASPWKPLGSSKEPTWHRRTLARQG